MSSVVSKHTSSWPSKGVQGRGQKLDPYPLLPHVVFRYIAPVTNEIGTIHGHFVCVRIENDAIHDDVLRLQDAISDEKSKTLNVAHGVGATFGLCTIPHDVAPSFEKTRPKLLKDFVPVYEAFVGELSSMQPGHSLAAECFKLQRSDLEEPLEDAADGDDIFGGEGDQVWPR